MSDAVETAFENWLYDNTPSEGIYEGGAERHSWTDERVRELMQMAFAAGWRAASGWDE